MASDPSHVIVCDQTCGSTAVHTHQVHHRDFPEIHVEGLSPGEAAGHLADRLTSILDSAASSDRRDQVLRAIDDVKHFLGHAAEALVGHARAAAANTAAAVATAQARPHAVVDVRPLGPDLATTRSGSLLKGNQIEVKRLVVAQGQSIPTHKAAGEVTVLCLEGCVDFEVGGHTHRLTPGHLVYLDRNEAHGLTGLEASSLLVTRVIG